MLYEYKSIESFIQYMIDDDRCEFNHEELQLLSFNLKLSTSKIRRELESYGLKIAKRYHENNARGINSPNHDRWYGKGSSATYGGSGGGSIVGMSDDFYANSK